MLGGQVFDLVGLLTNDLSKMFELSINHLLVLNVDERTNKDDDGAEQGKSPERKELDQVVGNEGREEGSASDNDILSKDDALGFDDEKVDKIFEVIERGLKGLFWDLVVPSRTDSARHTGSSHQFARHFCSSHHYSEGSVI